MKRAKRKSTPARKKSPTAKKEQNPAPKRGRRRLRVGETAAYMGLSRHMVRTLIHEGALPALMVSGSFLIEPRDIDAFLRTNQTGR